MEPLKYRMFFAAVILLFFYLFPGHYAALMANPESLSTYKMKRVALSISNVNVKQPAEVTTAGYLTNSDENEIKRLVPGGPNPEKSPGTPPIRSLLDSARFQVNDEISRLVPGGPNPEKSPGTPPLRSLLDSARFKVNHEILRLVPGGPNPEKSPGTPPIRSRSDSARFKVNHEVPYGSNPEESRKQDENVEAFAYFQSNSFEQAPPGL